MKYSIDEITYGEVEQLFIASLVLDNPEIVIYYGHSALVNGVPSQITGPDMVNSVGMFIYKSFYNSNLNVFEILANNEGINSSQVFAHIIKNLNHKKLIDVKIKVRDKKKSIYRDLTSSEQDCLFSDDSFQSKFPYFIAGLENTYSSIENYLFSRMIITLTLEGHKKALAVIERREQKQRFLQQQEFNKNVLNTSINSAKTARYALAVAIVLAVVSILSLILSFYETFFLSK